MVCVGWSLQKQSWRAQFWCITGKLGSKSKLYQAKNGREELQSRYHGSMRRVFPVLHHLNPPRKVDCTWELVRIPIFRVPTMVHESKDSPGFDDILQPEHHNHTAAFNSDAIICIWYQITTAIQLPTSIKHHTHTYRFYAHNMNPSTKIKLIKNKSTHSMTTYL